MILMFGSIKRYRRAGNVWKKNQGTLNWVTGGNPEIGTSSSKDSNQSEPLVFAIFWYRLMTVDAIDRL